MTLRFRLFCQGDSKFTCGDLILAGFFELREVQLAFELGFRVCFVIFFLWPTNDLTAWILVCYSALDVYALWITLTYSNATRTSSHPFLWISII